MVLDTTFGGFERRGLSDRFRERIPQSDNRRSKGVRVKIVAMFSMRVSEELRQRQNVDKWKIKSSLK